MMDLTNPHATPAADCLADLAATPDGLTATEAARRLAEHGPNRLPEVRSRGPLVRFLRQFHTVLIYVLIGAAVVTGALQHWIDTGVILAVVLANAMIGFIQEGKAEAAMAATVPISSPSGIWSSNSGKTGLSPSLLGVNSTARMSGVAVSVARCTLRPLSTIARNRLPGNDWRRP